MLLGRSRVVAASCDQVCSDSKNPNLGVRVVEATAGLRSFAKRDRIETRCSLKLQLLDEKRESNHTELLKNLAGSSEMASAPALLVHLSTALFIR